MKALIAYYIFLLALIAFGTLLFTYCALAGWAYLAILITVFFYVTYHKQED